MNYPTAQEALSMPHIILGDGESSHKVIRIHLEDRMVVYKLQDYVNLPSKKTLKTALKMLERPLFKLAISQSIESKLRVLGSEQNSFSYENHVLEAWKRLGIPCTTIIEMKKDALILDYVPSESYRDIMLRDGDHGTEFGALLETISKIRYYAYKYENISLLHPDMLLRNFLYDTKGGAIAIDPGVKIRDDLGLRKADALSNLFFTYYMKTNDDNRYIKTFIDTLEKPVIDMMKSIRWDLGIFARTYLGLRSRVGRLLSDNKTCRTYVDDTQRIELIRDLLE